MKYTCKKLSMRTVFVLCIPLFVFNTHVSAMARVTKQLAQLVPHIRINAAQPSKIQKYISSLRIPPTPLPPCNQSLPLQRPFPLLPAVQQLEHPRPDYNNTSHSYKKWLQHLAFLGTGIVYGTAASISMCEEKKKTPEQALFEYITNCTNSNYDEITYKEFFSKIDTKNKNHFCLTTLNSLAVANTLHTTPLPVIKNLIKSVDDSSSFCLKILNHYFNTDKLHFINNEIIFYLLENIVGEKQPEKSIFCLKVLNHYFNTDQIDFLFIHKLTSYLTETDKEFIDTKLRQKLYQSINYFDDTTPFDRYLKKYYSFIIQHSIDGFSKLPMLSTLAHIKQYAHEEHANNRIVFYHGQSSQWPLWQMVFKKLYSIKYHTTISDDFIFLRYTTTFISDTIAKSIKNKGVTLNNSAIKNYDHIIFFTNLVPFANDASSNSVLYAAYNTDQSTAQNKIPSNLIEHFFKELNMHKEYLFLQKTYPTLLDDLKKGFDTANKEQGNHGFLVAISMPKETARKLTYPTTNGGSIRPITINGRPTTDVVTIAENFDQVPFANEYCIILSKAILNPQEAKKAGIKMRYFNPLITPQPITKALHDFYEKLDEVIAIIQDHYEERTQK